MGPKKQPRIYGEIFPAEVAEYLAAEPDKKTRMEYFEKHCTLVRIRVLSIIEKEELRQELMHLAPSPKGLEKKARS
jgi:hypothetical protein